MKRLMLSVLCIGGLLSGADARADKDVQLLRYTTTTVGEVQASCGAFDILADYVTRWEVKLVDGVMVANHLRQEPARYYSSADPSIFVMSGPGEGQNNNHIDLATGDFRATLRWKIVVPGGPVFQETGLFVANMYTYALYRSTGHDDLVDGSGWAALCDYLSVSRTVK